MQLMANHGIPDYNRSVHEKEIGGMPMPAYMQWLIDRYELRNTTKELLNDEHLSIYKSMLPSIQFIPGALDFLKHLKANGKKIGIATACDMDIMDQVMSVYPEFSELIECLVTCTQAGAPKPDPAVYLMCLGRLGGTVDKAVVFEDSVPGLRGARASGMHVIGILSDPQYYADKV